MFGLLQLGNCPVEKSTEILKIRLLFLCCAVLDGTVLPLWAMFPPKISSVKSLALCADCQFPLEVREDLGFRKGLVTKMFFFCTRCNSKILHLL